MRFYITIAFMILFCVGMLIVTITMCKANSIIDQEEMKKKAADEARKKNEQKEQMESGDSESDFNSSLNILHNLAHK